LLAGACLSLAAPAFARAANTTPQPTASEAYRQVLAFATGIAAKDMPKQSAHLDALFERVERAAYRYGIMPEFALAVVAAEARYGTRISWARYDSWATYELTTRTKLPQYPAVLDDLDTALSELQLVLKDSQTMDEVFSSYWCGPQRNFNMDSLRDFTDAASKLWNGLRPYAEQRKANEDKGKYRPEYYNNNAASEDSAGWVGLAYGDLKGYSSGIKSMPKLASQLKAYPNDERGYVKAAKSFNKKLSDAEALVIVRAILSYCEQTEWAVDPRLVMAVVAAESSFKPKAVSRSGALGLGQLMPATARGFGIKDPFDPIQNLYGCVKYLERESFRWRSSQHKLDLIIASYNAGPGAVQKYGGVPPYRETKSYVKIVKGYYFKLAPDKRN
jgi:soluble lytic murein transglycosylase-like protein